MVGLISGTPDDEGGATLDSLLTEINGGRVIFFLGAGCSMGPPAELPSAPALAKRLIAEGHGSEGDSLESIAEQLNRESATALSEALPKAEWRARPCNDAHYTLAELAREGLVSDIVTTNWDVLIERALANTGVPYTPVVNPQFLREGGSAGGVRVAKIHGCIDHTEERLRATEEELKEWAAAWAKALFEYLVLTHIVVFVGYSGAAESVSVTLAAIVDASEKTRLSYGVDPRGIEGVPDNDAGRAFIDAMGGSGAQVFPMTADAFFSGLRTHLCPFLLERPRLVGHERVNALCQRTQVDEFELVGILDEIVATWKAIGPDQTQALLGVLLPGDAGLDHVHKYIPIVPNSGSISYVWLLLAVLLWSGYALPGEVGMLAAAAELNSSAAFLVVDAGGERRDVAGIAAVSELIRSGKPTAATLVVLVLGELGPLPIDHVADVSVARATERSSVVRAAGPMTAWIPASTVLETFVADADSDHVRGRIHGVLVDVVSRLGA